MKYKVGDKFLEENEIVAIESIEFCDTVISAIQELQQYRATGLTPHMVETLKENDKKSHRLAVQRATELDEYWAIGTQEECREAIENLISGKNINRIAHGLMNFDHKSASRITVKDHYIAVCHGAQLFSVRHTENDMVSLVYAEDPYQAIDIVKNGGEG